ncbi:MAG TPA: response regulator [Polyangiaceae bacterium]
MDGLRNGSALTDLVPSSRPSEGVTGQPLRVLLVEDSVDDAALVIRALQKGGYVVSQRRVEDAESMRDALAREAWDVVVSDWSMPQFSATAALRVLQESRIDIPFIIASGTVDEETAVTAMLDGAGDFLSKNRLTRLVPAVDREMRKCAHRRASRLIEEQLRHAQKMDAVGRLAGGVAHDFNNVLSVILSYSELMLADLKPGDPMRADVQEICTAGKRAASLTRQLLLFSRQKVAAPAVLDLNEVVRSMKNMLGRLLGADVDLTLRLCDDIGRVVADGGHMEQVMMNLTVNARDAMPEGGRLTIESKNVYLDEDYARVHHGVQAGSYVMVAVTDTGVGMDRETQTRIFEPFFTTKPAGKGTGLGLSTVFGIVQQAGGHLWVYSEPGTGTTFRVYLPRTDSPLSLAQELAPVESQRGTETILLVDDDDQVRAVARDILRRLGYVVIDTSNGGEALLLAEQTKSTIHLLLTDVVLPHLSGPQIAARLTAQRPETSVLFMSGYTGEGMLQHGLLDSTAAYLQKPITPEALSRRVREVLAARKRP